MISETAQPSTFTLEVLSATNNTLNKDELIKAFCYLASSSFAIDIVRLREIYEKSTNSSVEGYVINARKPYIDNQLSDYSEFAELIVYKNNGYKSCALIPIIIGGKVSIVIELLSQLENKFSQDLIKAIMPAAYLVGLSIMYSIESLRSNRLAGYFDSSFNTMMPQLLVSSDGKIVKTNKAATKAFGLSKRKAANIAEVMGMNFDQLFLLTKGTAVKASIDSEAKKMVFVVSANKISESLIEVSALDINDSENLNTIIQRICSDSDIGIVFLDPNKKIIEASGSLSKLISYQSNDILTGKDFIDLIDDDQKAQMRDLLDGHLEQVTTKSLDVINTDGKKVRLHVTIAKSGQGHILGFADAENEKSVKLMKDNLFDFINSSSDIVIIVDNNGYIKDANIVAQSVLGYSKEKLYGIDIKSIYYDPLELDRDMLYAAKGVKIDNSYINLIKSGTSEKVAATHSIRTVRDLDGNSEYLFVIKELETKRKLNEQESKIKKLEWTIKNLGSVGDLKSQFIYNISHELKTPLTSIKGYGKLLYDGEFGELSEQQKTNIKVILDEAERLGFIIQQVLDAAKLETKKVKLELNDVDLKELKDNSTIRSLERKALEKGLQFNFVVDYNVPKIIADPNRLLQVFINLISNAIKFTDKGSITIHIYNVTKKKIGCEVIDTGIGISDDEKKNIFKEFYQTKKGLVKQEGSGTGLGLSIAKYIVELHNGSISFESQQGKPTKFFFKLPVAYKPKKKKKR